MYYLLTVPGFLFFWAKQLSTSVTMKVPSPISFEIILRTARRDKNNLSDLGLRHADALASHQQGDPKGVAGKPEPHFHIGRMSQLGHS
jgi:hypothetical protein